MRLIYLSSVSTIRRCFKLGRLKTVGFSMSGKGTYFLTEVHNCIPIFCGMLPSLHTHLTLF